MGCMIAIALAVVKVVLGKSKDALLSCKSSLPKRKDWIPMVAT